jgi:hypothetical protein
MLTLPVTLADLWPADAVSSARPDDDAIDWLSPSRGWRERSSAVPLPFAGGLAVLCHEAAVAPAALQFLRECGLPAPGPVETFQDGPGARASVARLAVQGRRIGLTYAPRHPAAPGEAYVTELATFASLNDKAELAGLLPAGAAPAREVVAPDRLAAALARRNGSLPLVLKAGSRLGSGAGRDVAICRTPADLDAARRKLALAERIVIEEYCDFATTWCLHYAAGETGVTWCGATEQVSDAEGGYHGNWWAPGPGPGEAAVEVGRYAAIAGWVRGYRGFLGVDVGRTPDGRWLAFDLNFRVNGSTLQALVGDALVDAWGAGCTRLRYGIPFAGPFEEMLDRLLAFHRRRELLPVLVFDTPRLGLTGESDAPVCGVIAAGADRGAVAAVFDRMQEAGFACAD